jgi:hypothetical protein
MKTHFIAVFTVIMGTMGCGPKTHMHTHTHARAHTHTLHTPRAAGPREGLIVMCVEKEW